MRLRFIIRSVIISILGIILIASYSDYSISSSNTTSSKALTTSRDTISTRTPGEWEEQASVWMQWPNDYESNLRSSFIKIIAVIQQYEHVNLIVRNKNMKSKVVQVLQDQNILLANISFHISDYDNAWLRDNGPVYVFDKSGKWVLDFGFDGWGSGFGDDVEYENDNKIPQRIKIWLKSKYENNNNYILERGNLEANGKDIVMLNWDCQQDRNPDWSRGETETYFKEKFGISKVIWAKGHDPADATTGHIDGMARFVNESTVVIAQVPDSSTESYSGERANLDNLAADAESAGLAVERFPIPGFIVFKGEELPAMYMNYLVGNKFVLGMAFGNDLWDNAAKVKLQSLYPNRTVYMVEVNELWHSGGGIHCVTNDEPLF